MKEIINGNTDYQKPQISEVVICTEGVLCGSQTGGSTNGLTKENMDDIWY